jgi:TRAP-type C4-dicarboxylate transport system substrate-binding protein
MTRLFHLVLSATLMTTLSVGTARAATIIKLGSLAPSGSPWDKGLRQIAAQWSALSGGAVTLKIYPGGIAGDEEDMIRKMRIGQISAAGMTGVGMCRIYSGVLAVQLPLIIQDDAELAYILDKMKPLFIQQIEKEGFTVLIWSKVGWVHFFSKKPVVTPADLKAMKQFVWAGDPASIQAWKEAGFQPVPLAVTDLMSSLQSGMVEAFTSTALSAASYQWYNITKNMCGMRWAPLLGGIVINTSVWKSIPADLQTHLLAEAQKIGDLMQQEIDKADADAVVAMQQHGLAVSVVSPEVVAQWKAATQSGFAKLAGVSFDKAAYELVLKYADEYRASHGR